MYTNIYHTHTRLRVSDDQKEWEVSVESWQRPDSTQCREILVLRGLFFVAGSGFSEWHSSHCTGHRDRSGWPERILGGGKQWLKAAHKCLLFSSGPLTLCLPAKQGPVRPAPLSNSLISRKNNNVQTCFNWNKHKGKPQSCSPCLSLSVCSLRLQSCDFSGQLTTNETTFLHCSMRSMTTGRSTSEGGSSRLWSFGPQG